MTGDSRHIYSGHSKLFGLTVSLLLSASAASAQDWSGWYAGLSLGSYSASADETETILASGNQAHNSYSGDGVTFGVHVGHNWQQDRFVYGVELGLRTGEEVELFFNDNNVYDYSQRGMLDLKTRFGYLVRDNTQIFASAGLALGSLRYDWTAAGVNDVGGVRSKGYSVGLGVERLVGSNGVLRMSMDYTERSAEDFTTPLFPGSSWDADHESLAVSVGYSVFLER